jgi:hypothetical protein
VRRNKGPARSKGANYLHLRPLGMLRATRCQRAVTPDAASLSRVSQLRAGLNDKRPAVSCGGPSISVVASEDEVASRDGHQPGQLDLEVGQQAARNNLRHHAETARLQDVPRPEDTLAS